MTRITNLFEFQWGGRGEEELMITYTKGDTEYRLTIGTESITNIALLALGIGLLSYLSPFSSR